MINIPTPELDKMHGVHEQSQAIGEFLDWLQIEKNWTIASWEDNDDIGELYPVSFSIEKLLAEYFEIDLQKAEEEKRAILEAVRKSN